MTKLQTRHFFIMPTWPKTWRMHARSGNVAKAGIVTEAGIVAEAMMGTVSETELKQLVPAVSDEMW